MKHFFYLLGFTFGTCVFSTAEAATGPAVGTVAPDFKVHNLVTGEEVTLNSQRGKVVILTFWASWCPPCKRELPILEGAERAVGKDRLVVFAVSYRDTDAALTAIKKPAAAWQIDVMTDRNAHVASLYSVSKIPHLFMIGRDGKVVANHLGYGDRTLDELLADINRALAAPLPSALTERLMLSPEGVDRAAAWRRCKGRCADLDVPRPCCLLAEGWLSNPTIAKRPQERW